MLTILSLLNMYHFQLTEPNHFHGLPVSPDSTRRSAPCLPMLPRALMLGRPTLPARPSWSPFVRRLRSLHIQTTRLYDQWNGCGLLLCWWVSRLTYFTDYGRCRRDTDSASATRIRIVGCAAATCSARVTEDPAL